MLRRVLRRRARRYKPGANPGGPIRSWAEYSAVTLSPVGDGSFVKRIVLLLIAPFALLMPAILILATAAGRGGWVVTNEAFEASMAEWAIYAALSGIAVLIAGLMLVVSATSLWRIVRSNFPA